MNKPVMMFNPYTGTPRDPRDIASDPQGLLIWDGETPLRPYVEPPSFDEWADNWGAMNEQHRYVAREAWNAALAQRPQQAEPVACPFGCTTQEEHDAHYAAPPAVQQAEPVPYAAWRQGWKGVAEFKAERAAPPAVNPAPGYCPHCKQYTIAEPLPADDEAVRLLREARKFGLHAELIDEIDAYLAKVTSK